MINYEEVQEEKSGLWKIIISEDNYLQSNSCRVESYHVDAHNEVIAKLVARAAHDYIRLEKLNKLSYELCAKMNATSRIIDKYIVAGVSERINDIIQQSK